MKRSSLKKLIICVISVLIMTLVAFNYIGIKSYAANTSDFDDFINEDADDIDQDDEFGDDEEEDEDEARKKAEEEAAAKKKAEEAAAKKKAEEEARKKAEEQKTYDAKKDDGIPDAGLDNSGIFVIIAVSSISAIFAYRKFKEYKNI